MSVIPFSNQRSLTFHVVDPQTTYVNSMRDSVWTRKTIHRDGFKIIAASYKMGYREVEDLFEEAAMEYAEKMYRKGVRDGNFMTRPLRRSA